MIGEVVQGQIGAGTDVCCLDVDGDGQVTANDEAEADAIANGWQAAAGTCSPSVDPTVGVVTYGLDVDSLGGSSEPYTVPLDVITELHQRVLSNPLLDSTDVVLLPEFAYSNRDNPVELEDHGVGAVPRYTVTNQNAIADRVEELQQLAGDHQVNIVVPLAERAIYLDENQQEVPVLRNSTIVIDIDGNIQHRRRKTYDMLGNTSASVEAQCVADQYDSFEVFELRTRRATSFTSIIVICAEMGPGAFVERMASNDWHADLLLYPEGLFSYLHGDETMKRMQFFPDGDWEHAEDLHSKVADYLPYVDHFAYAGLNVGPMESQGIFAMTPGPISYIFTEQQESAGFLYGRFTPTAD